MPIVLSKGLYMGKKAKTSLKAPKDVDDFFSNLLDAKETDKAQKTILSKVENLEEDPQDLSDGFNGFDESDALLDKTSMQDIDLGESSGLSNREADFDKGFTEVSIFEESKTELSAFELSTIGTKSALAHDDLLAKEELSAFTVGVDLGESDDLNEDDELEMMLAEIEEEQGIDGSLSEEESFLESIEEQTQNEDTLLSLLKELDAEGELLAASKPPRPPKKKQSPKASKSESRLEDGEEKTIASMVVSKEQLDKTQVTVSKTKTKTKPRLKTAVQSKAKKRSKNRKLSTEKSKVSDDQVFNFKSPRSAKRKTDDLEKSVSSVENVPKRMSGFQGESLPELSNYDESEFLEIAQKRINNLEKECLELRKDNEELAHLCQKYQGKYDALMESQKSHSVKEDKLEKDLLGKIEVYKTKFSNQEKISKELEEEIDSYKQRLSGSFDRVRRRERELESRLEIMKKDTEAICEDKDKRFLELKKQFQDLEDRLERERMDFDKLQQSQKDQNKRLVKTIETLKVALSLVEGEEL